MTLFLSREGYFKKITAQSLRMSGEQKYKEGDGLMLSFESSNRRELLFLTDRQQMYKCRVSDFEDGKASVLGIYLPTRLQMDEGESVLTMIDPGDYRSHLLLFFENGKAARIELSAYETKTNRKKLANAYSDKSPLVAAVFVTEETDILLRTTSGHALVFNSGMILPKSTRDSQGVQVITLRKNAQLASAKPIAPEELPELEKYRAKSVPAAGKPAKELGDSNQLSFT